MEVTQPKFNLEQEVKFIGDHNKKAGKVLEIKFHSGTSAEDHSGWTYTVSSKYYEPEINDMIEGHKICKEEELVSMDEVRLKEAAAKKKAEDELAAKAQQA